MAGLPRGTSSAAVLSGKPAAAGRKANLRTKKVVAKEKDNDDEDSSGSSTERLAIDGQKIARGGRCASRDGSDDGGGGGGGDDDVGALDFFERRILKPIPEFLSASSELRDLAENIRSEILVQNPNVHFGDIAGSDDAKLLLKESVVFPVKFPRLFAAGGIVPAPWRGILLYGPPGTGKTMLAKAVATECQTTFFNISASSIVSKWRGDSEKLIRVLFALARYYAPSTIFLDELDSIMSHRHGDGGGSGFGEHEGSHRMKTELLIQMDGLARSEDLVFVLAASNLPWALDTAVRRRLEKRILVPLPNMEARKKIFASNLLRARCDQDVNMDRLAECTEGYSGADIVSVCKESMMRPLRRIMRRLEDPTLSPTDRTTVSLDPVCMEDVEAALQATRPSAKENIEKYERFSKEFGSGIGPL